MRPLLLLVALATAGALPHLHAATPASKVEVTRLAEQLLADNYANDGPGAAVIVARGDEVLFRGARGEADLDRDVPLTADAMFRIGSVTKQFAAAGLLKLVEAGQVALDDPLSKYLANFPNGERITVLELLNHTSGVKSYTGIPGYMVEPIRKDLDTAALVDVFKGLPVDFAPGEGWAYNNSGYVLVGAVIEAASGRPWHRYLEDTLFKPLGMRHTGYGADPSIVARQVHGYTRDGDKFVAARPLSMTQPHAAGALVSSVDDLLKWNRALHEGKVLQSDTYRRMITPTGKAVDAGYGFGLFRSTVRGNDAIAHGGGIHGFSSVLSYLPGPDVSVVVLQNNDGGGRHAGPEQIARTLAAVALGDPYPSATPIALDEATLKQVEGVYRLDANTARVLRVVDGKLTSQCTGGARSVLIPIAKDTYLYEDGFNRFTIERDATGAVSAMRFFPEGEGAGQVVVRSDEPLPADRPTVTLPRAALERVAGRYAANGVELRVFLEGGQLKAQLAGQPAIDLHAETASRFFPTVVDATLEFAPGDGMAQMTTLRQGGQVIEFKRTQ